MLYQEALISLYPSLSEHQKNVLGALLFAKGNCSSAGQLSRLLGVAVVQINAALGRVGRQLFELVGAHPEGLLVGEFEWWHMLATGEHTKMGFMWSLRPEAIAALVGAGCNVGGSPLAEEVEDVKLLEGAFRQVAVNAYERNPVARRRCIDAHGLSCAACGFNFESVYGPAAAGFIHVHHVIPLATLGMEYEVDPIADLIPLCPNCHSVAHLVNPPHSIDQLKTMLGASHVQRIGIDRAQPRSDPGLNKPGLKFKRDVK